MAGEDDDKPREPLGYVLGQPLEALSVAELDERMEELRREIVRLEAARGQKLAAQAAAATFFKS
ncbi:MAG TPA: DUF1192 domain-containing protein [Methylocystis sp.]|nr:DUF1192 domain-containing protein [Methylocystis sp.]